MHKALDNYLEKLNCFIAHHDIDPNDPSYPEIRMQGFGASDAAALLGVSKYGTKENLIKDKVERNTHPEINDIPAVRKGKDCEHIFIGYAEKFLENPIIKPEHMYGMSDENKKDIGLRVNFDGVMKIKRNKYVPVEIKLCTYWGRKNYDWSKAIGQPNHPNMNHINTGNPTLDADFYGIPINYYCQLQQQMMFLNAEYGFLAVMDDNDWKMYYYYVRADKRFWKLLQHTAKVEYTLLRMKRGEKVEIIYGDI